MEHNLRETTKVNISNLFRGWQITTGFMKNGLKSHFLSTITSHAAADIITVIDLAK